MYTWSPKRRKALPVLLYGSYSSRLSAKCHVLLNFCLSLLCVLQPRQLSQGNVFDFDDEEIARQLTLMDHRLFATIQVFPVYFVHITSFFLFCGESLRCPLCIRLFLMPIYFYSPMSFWARLGWKTAPPMLRHISSTLTALRTVSLRQCCCNQRQKRELMSLPELFALLVYVHSSLC